MTDSISKILTTFLMVITLLLNSFSAFLDALVSDPSTTQPPETSSVVESTEADEEDETADAPTNNQGSNTNPSYDEATFVFTAYGYGHGVGMSQEGAIAMAKAGSTYDEILTHYFTGTTVETDSKTPATVKYGGTEIPIVEYLCKATRAEIGTGRPAEALKAQIVAIYTYAKWYKFDVGSSRHAYNSSFNYEGTDIHEACLAVLGLSGNSDTMAAKYVDYKGEAAFTCYFASSAGKTASAENTWGGNEYPYLVPVNSSEEVVIRTYEISAADLKAKILAHNSSVKLSENPADWIEIISQDGAVTESTGYVAKMRVGDLEMKGNTFRSILGYSNLRSHCFSVSYFPAK